MAIITFDVPIAGDTGSPAKKKAKGTEGAAASDPGYTFHHVLPWRYYYLAGYIIANCARLMIVADTKQVFGRDQARSADAFAGEQARLASDAAKAAEYGPGWAAFYSEVLRKDIDASDYDVRRLLELCSAMRGASAYDALRQDFDLVALARTCVAPRFGGFYGPAGKLRCDEPQEQPEPIRPANANQDWWGELQGIGEALRSMCPAIAHARSGATVRCTVDGPNWKRLRGGVARLAARYNNQVYDFNPDDWSYKYAEFEAPWELIVDFPMVLRFTNKEAPSLFKLRAYSQYGGKRVRYEERGAHALKPKHRFLNRRTPEGEWTLEVFPPI